MEKISIIIPVFNSQSTLIALNNEIDGFFKDKPFEIEKIFVDDASKDSSVRILKDLVAYQLGRPTIKVISLKKNVGQQNALFCGIRYASGDYIVTMDDDLQHDVAYVEALVNCLKVGADLVYGVHPAPVNSTRNLGSKLTGMFFKRRFPELKGLRVSSFRAFNKSLIAPISNCHYRFIYLSALLLAAARQVENIPVTKRPRPSGQSGYNLWKLTKLFLKLHFYYGKWWPEWMKPKGDPYEEIDDAWCRQLSAECH